MHASLRHDAASAPPTRQQLWLRWAGPPLAAPVYCPPMPAQPGLGPRMGALLKHVHPSCIAELTHAPARLEWARRPGHSATQHGSQVDLHSPRARLEPRAVLEHLRVVELSPGLRNRRLASVGRLNVELPPRLGTGLRLRRPVGALSRLGHPPLPVGCRRLLASSGRVGQHTLPAAVALGAGQAVLRLQDGLLACGLLDPCAGPAVLGRLVRVDLAELAADVGQVGAELVHAVTLMHPLVVRPRAAAAPRLLDRRGGRRRWRRGLGALARQAVKQGLHLAHPGVARRGCSRPSLRLGPRCVRHPPATPGRNRRLALAHARKHARRHCSRPCWHGLPPPAPPPQLRPGLFGVGPVHVRPDHLLLRLGLRLSLLVGRFLAVRLGHMRRELRHRRFLLQPPLQPREVRLASRRGRRRKGSLRRRERG
mmetsp:Transcript_29605/g.94180  ORF Transcript_29605/g.94180 Transcript_29605/m.94180 type:complete len:424 (-) Transcript_29605:252-1523(-)